MLQHGFRMVEDLVGVGSRIISRALKSDRKIIVKMVGWWCVKTSRFVEKDWNFWERRELSIQHLIWAMAVLRKWSSVLLDILVRDWLSWINFRRLLIPYTWNHKSTSLSPLPSNAVNVACSWRMLYSRVAIMTLNKKKRLIQSISSLIRSKRHSGSPFLQSLPLPYSIPIL